MNRIEEKMNQLKAQGKKAFITYTTAGLPDMDTTEKIMFAQEEAGIDVMELITLMPYGLVFMMATFNGLITVAKFIKNLHL